MIDTTGFPEGIEDIDAPLLDSLKNFEMLQKEMDEEKSVTENVKVSTSSKEEKKTEEVADDNRTVKKKSKVEKETKVADESSDDVVILQLKIPLNNRQKTMVNLLRGVPEVSLNDEMRASVVETIEKLFKKHGGKILEMFNNNSL